MDNGLFSRKSLRPVILSVIALISSQCIASQVLAQRHRKRLGRDGCARYPHRDLEHGDQPEADRRAAFLNARNFFATGADGLKRNQYGLAVGGPVIKNRTFFFFSWQGTQLRQQSPTTTAVVPTLEQRQGNFSSLLTGAQPTQLVDPTTKVAVPGNIIPAAKLD